MKICFLSTSSYSLDYFLRLYIDALAEDNEVGLICNTAHGRPLEANNVSYHQLDFKRQPNIVSDIVDVFRLVRLLRREDYDILYTISPKGGLIGAIAGAIARVPARVHFYTGQVWVNKKGAMKFALKNMDKLIHILSTSCLVDSESQRSFLIENKVISAQKSLVLGLGSVSGIDVDRFRRKTTFRDEIRSELAIDDSTVSILFVGRLNKDKGLNELISAFIAIKQEINDICLVLVGPDEGMLDVINKFIFRENIQDSVHIVGNTDKPEKYYSASDILCLPSYREGFGAVVIEAACAGLPAVVSNIYGLQDAVDDKNTGLLCKVSDADDLAIKLKEIVGNVELRNTLGEAAEKRAVSEFSSERMEKEFLKFHADLVKEKLR